MAITKEELEKKREKENSLLFYKTMTCPICEKSLKWRTIKSGKLRVEGSDVDMRPHYYGVDANKYHIVACPHCGYAALERYFTAPMVPIYIKGIKEGLQNHTPKPEDPEYISYRDAYERYHMALNCATMKGPGVKASEVAYICLKTAWLLRGEQEELNENDEFEKAKALERIESMFLQKAYGQFTNAIMQESFPMCGMDEPTVDYLVAALAVHEKEFSTAYKLLSSVITSYAASNRLKDKARELRDVIKEEKGVEEE